MVCVNFHRTKSGFGGDNIVALFAIGLRNDNSQFFTYVLYNGFLLTFMKLDGDVIGGY